MEYGLRASTRAITKDEKCEIIDIGYFRILVGFTLRLRLSSYPPASMLSTKVGPGRLAHATHHSKYIL